MDLRGVYGKNSIWDAARLALVLACLLGPYLFGYFALAYFGKWVFLRFAVALSSAQEQKLAEEAQALRDAVATLQTTYASFWRRLGAYVLALGVFIVGLVTFLLGVGGSPFLQTLPGFAYVGLLLIPFVVGWLYQAMMLSSRPPSDSGQARTGNLCDRPERWPSAFWQGDSEALRLRFSLA